MVDGLRAGHKTLRREPVSVGTGATSNIFRQCQVAESAHRDNDARAMTQPLADSTRDNSSSSSGDSDYDDFAADLENEMMEAESGGAS